MKLYSRRQTLVFSLIAAVIFASAGFFAGIKYSTGNAGLSEIQSGTSSNPADFEESAENGFVQTENSHNLNMQQHGNTAALNTANEKGYMGYSPAETQNIHVYETTNEGVVNITTETMGVNWFFEPVPVEGGSGSGSIIDESGLVLTNTHVIAEASKIFISLHDGSQYEARVVGMDPENDLAVLKFDPPKNVKLTVIKFGDSAGLKVGQRVLAIGNPFGLERTLTDGIVSALKRPIQNDKNIIIKNMIQTDTAINPGNSGGPLLDTMGKMIGINTMIYSTSGSSAGVGFAVPVNTAKRVVADILKYGKVIRGSIDAELVQVSGRLASYAKLPVSYGLLVSEVKRGSNAAKADLRGGNEAVRSGIGRYSSVFYIGGDIIVEIAGQKINNITDYYSVLEDKKPGETVTVKVIRGKKLIDLRVTLSERN
ncbi:MULTISPECIES: S1C family serine protease [unclassified Treponema]|uniref:S1C family serine protease n=1 Tax=unclassified Treponema TaxID=2638727 RepID=UPI0020A4A6A5|nr:MULTISPECIES: trypsin-like peptidase domain-containing protein [unclassified Treponema]UTC68344.1 trypsin-like peptidase domain-containing protein [Treponema sp. OMZ 789]UTC71064.1 trypsin-like peptidase domain-containing protein [Treponema sp. OMZ 790]UTC73805.1 trypsin-like peptidase domain-containing protein [Treponema sp. OMZ 791]